METATWVLPQKVLSTLQNRIYIFFELKGVTADFPRKRTVELVTSLRRSTEGERTESVETRCVKRKRLFNWFQTSMTLFILLLTIQCSCSEKKNLTSRSRSSPIHQKALTEINCSELATMSELSPGFQSFQINLSHPVFRTDLGYIPGVVYQVTIRESGDNSSTYALKSVLNGTESQYVGQFTEFAANIMDTCEEEEGVAIVTRDLKNNGEEGNADLEWKAPVQGTGCVQFVGMVLSSMSEAFYEIHLELCERLGEFVFLSSMNGRVESDGYPNKYRDNSVSTAVIQVPSQYRIHLQFQAFDLEEPYEGHCYDNVTVWSSEHQGYSPGPLCGKYTREQLPSLNFVSDGNYMIIKFVADGKIGGLGYNAVYYAVGPSGELECNQTLTDQNGTIKSPNYPRQYFPNLHCTTVIEAPNDTHVFLRIIDLDLQNQTKDDGLCKDYVEVWTSPQKKQTLCSGLQSQLPQLTFESVSENMQVTFHSDYAIEGTGFLATYTVIKSCEDRVLRQENGTITSIMYPENYLNSQHCTFEINITDPWFVVELQFQHLNTEAKDSSFLSDDNCDKDYVEIFDGRTKHRRCGNWAGRFNQLKFRSFGPVMTVRFFSDESGVRSGFSATWQTVINDSSQIPCSVGWHSYKDSCFWIANNAETWQKAKTSCDDRGSMLAVVSSEEVGDFLDAFILQQAKDIEETQGIWIGASDRSFEADFYWTDGTKVSYSNWFPGWSQFDAYNSQPNDDGLSNQDCVELRKSFTYPSKGWGRAHKYFWNDRECNTLNRYICQQLKPGVVSRPPVVPYCHDNIILSPSNNNITIVTPGFPSNYQDFVDCNISFSAPEAHFVEVRFSHFHLEEEDRCTYDYVKLGSGSAGAETVTHCGNWEGRLKLLHYVTLGPSLLVQFHSDHSGRFPGFQATVSSVPDSIRCGGTKWHLHSPTDTCYILNHSPQVSWREAEAKCNSAGGHLASVPDAAINDFLLDKLTSSADFTAGAIYWLGGKLKVDTSKLPPTAEWYWESGALFTYTAWSSTHKEPIQSEGQTDQCLGYLTDQTEPQNPRWQEADCETPGGFICQRLLTGMASTEEYNLTGDGGNITSPRYPLLHYPNDIKVVWHILGPISSRILFLIHFLELEVQSSCLYDYVTIQDVLSQRELRYCTFYRQLQSYATSGNRATVVFHSDFETNGRGFHIEWIAVNVSTENLYVEPEGAIKSLFYPITYLNDLHTHSSVNVDQDVRIFLQFEAFDLHSADSTDELSGACQDYVNLTLPVGMVFHLCPVDRSVLHNWKFLAPSNQLELDFVTDSDSNDPGFYATYKAVRKDEYFTDTFAVQVAENETGQLWSLNHPYPYPHGVETSVTLTAPLGHQIVVEIHTLDILNTSNCASTYLRFVDPHHRELDFADGVVSTLCGSKDNIPGSFNVTSYLNSLRVEFKAETGVDQVGTGYLLQYTTVQDPYFFNKTKFSYDVSLASCTPLPCYHGASCVTIETKTQCQCTGFYTGLLCAWTYCDQDPCENGGHCSLTPTSYNCSCPSGYSGRNCQVNLDLCARDSCSSNGVCRFNSKWTQTCACNAGWQGGDCGLTDRYGPGPDQGSTGVKLLEEPFWIGIIVVVGVLLLTGAVMLLQRKCLRHFNYDICCCCTQSTHKSSIRSSSGHTDDRVTSLPASPSPSPMVFTNAACSPEPSPKSTENGSTHHNFPVIKVQMENESPQTISPSLSDSRNGGAMDPAIKLFSSYNGSATSFANLMAASEASLANLSSNTSSNGSNLNLISEDPELELERLRLPHFKRSRSEKSSGSRSPSSPMRRAYSAKAQHSWSHHPGSVDDIVLTLKSPSLDSARRERDSSWSSARDLRIDLELGEGHKSAKTVYPGAVDLHGGQTLSVLAYDGHAGLGGSTRSLEVFDDSGEPTELQRRSRANSAQRRKDFINSVRQARYLSRMEDSVHSSGSNCRSCGSHCSVGSYESYDSRGKRSSYTSKSLEYMDCDPTWDLVPRCFHRSHESEGHSPLTRNNSHSSEQSTGSHHKRHRSHRHRHGHHRHSRHRSRHHSGSRSKHRSSSGSGSRQRNDWKGGSVSLDIPDEHYHSPCRHDSSRSWLAERSRINPSRHSASSSSNNQWDHRKLERTSTSDWSLERSNRHVASDRERYRHHRRLEESSSNTTTESHSRANHSGRSPGHHRIHKSRSVEIVDPHSPLRLDQRHLHGRPRGGFSYESDDVASVYSHRDSLISSTFESTSSRFDSLDHSGNADSNIVVGFIADTDLHAKSYLQVPSGDFFSDNMPYIPPDYKAYSKPVVDSAKEVETEEKGSGQASDGGADQDSSGSSQQEGPPHIELIRRSPSGNLSELKLEEDYFAPCNTTSDSIPEEAEDDAETNQAQAPTSENEAVGFFLPAGTSSPNNKHPLLDSAYQSKEQSTEKCNSKPTSNTVSPTLTNGTRPKDDIFGVYQPSIAGTEDKRVTNQLELAARKLAALKEEEKTVGAEAVGEGPESIPLQRMDSRTANSTLSFYFHDALSLMPQKQRRLFPSRMLSMIADEEAEGSDSGPPPLGMPPANLDEMTGSADGPSRDQTACPDDVYVSLGKDKMEEESVTEV